MTSNNPHFLLFSEASPHRRPYRTWRFVLQNLDTKRRFCATDSEPIACGERLELLAVVRGLEALDQPARVTLVTRSRYVSRGIKSGLAEWRANNWQWERFGRLVPVRDHDLWRRVDRALRFHQVDCQSWQFEEIAPVRNRTRVERRQNRLPRQMQTNGTSLASESPDQPRPAISGVRPGQRHPKRELKTWTSTSVKRWSLWQETLRAVTRPMRQAFAAMA